MEVPQSKPIVTLVRASWESTRTHRIRFFVFISLLILGNVVDLAGPWAFGYVLGVFVKMGFSDEAFYYAGLGILAYTGLRLVTSICHHVARYQQVIVAYHSRMEVMSRLFDSFMTFPLRWHLKSHSGSNLAKLHRSVGAIDQMVGTYSAQIIEALVKVVFAGITILALDKLVALNVLIMCVVTMVAMLFFNKQIVRNIRENNLFYDKLNRTVIDYLFNVITVKMLRLEASAKTYFSAHKEKGLGVASRIALYQELKWGSIDIGYSVMIGSSLWIYLIGHRAFKEAFDIAQVYVLMNYLDRICQVIGSFTAYFSGILESATAYEDGNKVLREADAVPRTIHARNIPLDWQVLKISDLTFSYGTSESTGIRGFDLDLKRGEKVALVGPSGGGKSTLIKILGGMIPPDRASVTIDSTQSVTIDDLSQISLLLPQEPEIFSETVRFNLTFNQNFRPEELQFFVSLCKVDGVIARIPGGWEANLAEKGGNLSVGEKQRVALARGLVRAEGKDLLLLDEPTSSLDPMTEKEIFYALLHHFRDRTIVTACHRLALVPLFDKIVYIRNGWIEETGSFQELLDKKGGFARAWDDYERKILKAGGTSEQL